MKTVSQLRNTNIHAIERISATRNKPGSSMETGAELQTRSIMYEFRNGTPYRSAGAV